MKIEDFRPIRSQDSAPIKFDWLLTQESDWIIWTNQKITLIIFWLVKNGKDWNPAIPLVKRIFLVPDHIWPKTIKGQPALTHVIRNYVLLLVVPPLCLWWVTHSDESAQAQNSSRATTTLVSPPPHSTGLGRGNCKTRWDEKHFSVGIWCTYTRDSTASVVYLIQASMWHGTYIPEPLLSGCVPDL